MKQDFYKDRLSDRGIEVIIPDDVDVDVVNRIILEELCVGKINEKSRKIFQKIIEKMQETLHVCGMSEIYIVNPYECFLLMCLLTDCPLAVFADIWEMSYEEM